MDGSVVVNISTGSWLCQSPIDEGAEAGRLWPFQPASASFGSSSAGRTHVENCFFYDDHCAQCYTEQGSPDLKSRDGMAVVRRLSSRSKVLKLPPRYREHAASRSGDDWRRPFGPSFPSPVTNHRAIAWRCELPPAGLNTPNIRCGKIFTDGAYHQRPNRQRSVDRLCLVRRLRKSAPAIIGPLQITCWRGPHAQRAQVSAA